MSPVGALEPWSLAPAQGRILARDLPLHPGARKGQREGHGGSWPPGTGRTLTSGGPAAALRRPCGSLCFRSRGCERLRSLDTTTPFTLPTAHGPPPVRARAFLIPQRENLIWEVPILNFFPSPPLKNNCSLWAAPASLGQADRGPRLRKHRAKASASQPESSEPPGVAEFRGKGGDAL